MRRLNELFAQLEDGNTTVLTANRRLARYLRLQYDRSQQQQGKTVWRSADILPLTAWVERCWQNSNDDRILLTDFQEQALWEQIIRTTDASSLSYATLSHLTALANNAKQAWHLLQEWCLTLADIAGFANENTQAFAQWAHRFQTHCRQQHWLERTRLTAELLMLWRQAPPALPKHLIFAGFDLMPPRQQQLMTALQAHATITQFIPEECATSQVQQLGLLNTEQEIYHMAAWAKHHLQQNPQAQIGCIIPKLSQLRPTIERIFTEVLAPTALLPGNADEDLPFNISGGKWSTEYPLIQNALRALTLNFAEVELTLFSDLLRSPFLGGSAQEAEARAALDLALRRSLAVPRFSLRDTFAFARQTDSAHYCPLWLTQMRAFLQENKRAKSQHLPSGWAALFQRQLRCLGWPGERTLNSAEYQVWQRWQTLLTEFASLDWVLGRIHLTPALRQLQHLAGSIMFQPETPEAPIQILGLFEATDLTFDALWVMGLSDRDWPPPLTPNPLLPLALQRQLNMPQANAAHELAFHQRLTQKFAHSARQALFSYPQQTAEHGLQPSALIKHYEPMAGQALKLPLELPAPLIFAHQALEPWVDNSAPPLTPYEATKGGVTILQQQAACPLRAFVKCRLHAHDIPQPQWGLNEQQRGELVHAALTNVWQALKSQTALQRLSATELHQLINAAIAATLRQFTKKYRLVLTAADQKLEAQRLQKLLTQWLAVERQRAPFTVVAHEHVQDVLLADVPLRLRLDRIDQLADGTQVIIDYKTGAHFSLNDWLGERPDEPQLPLYAITHDGVVGGLLFAQVRLGKMQFVGITAQPQTIPGVKVLTESKMAVADWPTLMTQWRETLHRLAEDFANGNAIAAPKEQVETCRYCDLHGFCRIRQNSKLPMTT